VSWEPDPELEELFGDDPALQRTAQLLRSAPHPGHDPDAAFVAGLRQRLVEEAAERSGRRRRRWGWVRSLLSLIPPRLPLPTALPPSMVVAGAALSALLVVAAVVALRGLPGGSNGPGYTSPLNHAQEVGVVTPIEVHFNQPMDRGSVERSIHIEPATPVKAYRWRGNVLEIVPAHGLAPGTRYRVTVDPTTARTASDRPLKAAPAITFTTAPAKGHPRPSASPSPSPSASASPAPSPSPSAGGSPAPSASPEPSRSPEPSASPVPSASPSAGASPAPSRSPNPASSPTPAASPSPISSRQPSPRASPSVRPVGLPGSVLSPSPVTGSSPGPSQAPGSPSPAADRGAGERTPATNQSAPADMDASPTPAGSRHASPSPRPHPSPSV
jgi:hypothetical protein